MALANGGSFDPAGPIAREIAGLWWLLLALGVAAFVVFAAVLVLALRRPRGSVDEEPSTRGQETAKRLILGGGVILPVVVLIAMFGYTLKVMDALPRGGGGDALVIEVVGHQWWWEARYPEQGITTANEIHFPAGRPVELRLTAADVIHSFWVPRLAGKLDLLPEDTNTLVVEADRPGVYPGQCAEFCGLQHAKMRLLAIAQSPEAFASWVAAQQKAAAAPKDALARRGERVYAASGCGNCHAIDGTGGTVADGPDLTHFAGRRTIGAGILPNTRQNLEEWVVDPHRAKRGVRMPATDLSEEELDALLAYLESLE